MFFDRRRQGRGLTVGTAVPPINATSARLEPGDILYPFVGLTDIGCYAVVDTPCWLRFWRPSRATLMRQPNPFWEVGAGLSVVENYAIDFLHTAALGVMASVVCQVVWSLLLSNVFTPHGAAAKHRLAIGIGCLNVQLNEWYTLEKRRGRHPNEVQYLTPQMFGTPTAHTIKSKGAETVGLFRWCVESLLPQFSHRLDRGAALRSCSETLLTWYTEYDAMPDCPSGPECERCEHLALLHLIRLRRAGIHRKPKHHLFWHMCSRTVCSVVYCPSPCPRSSLTRSPRERCAPSGLPLIQ